jgi:hypothetical protein
MVPNPTGYGLNTFRTLMTSIHPNHGRRLPVVPVRWKRRQRRTYLLHVECSVAHGFKRIIVRYGDGVDATGSRVDSTSRAPRTNRRHRGRKSAVFSDGGELR